MFNLLVGLGNPGAEYDNTRHNIGFAIIDRIASVHSIDGFANKFNAQVLKASLQGHDIIMLKPTTYMNNAGIAVLAAAQFYKIQSNQVFVIHDDIDLEYGKIKIKRGGGSGGHNGLKSIDQHLGADYWRIRVGISKPNNRMDVSDYVLQRFNKEQLEICDEVIQGIADNILILLEEGKDKFFLKFHK